MDTDRNNDKESLLPFSYSQISDKKRAINDKEKIRYRCSARFI